MLRGIIPLLKGKENTKTESRQMGDRKVSGSLIT